MAGSMQASLPAIFHSLRYYSQEILQTFYDEFMKTSKSLKSLRKLFTIMHCNGCRMLPEEITIAIVATLCDKSLPFSERCLCIQILLECSPNDSLNLQDLNQGNSNETNLSFLEFMLSSWKKPRIINGNGFTQDQVEVRKITSEETKLDFRLRALRIMAQADYPPGDDVDTLALYLRRYIVSHGLTSSVPTQTFQFKGVTEMDGFMATQLVTVLNIVNVQSNSQQLNIQTFSILHQIWDTIFVQDFPLSSSQQSLLDSIVNYCLHIIEQAERQPISQLDVNFQQAALIEALNLLREACRVDGGPILRILPIIRRVHDQTNSLEIAVPVLQFLIEHGRHIAYDPTHELEIFFSVRLRSALNSVCTSCEAVYFIKKNVIALHSMPSQHLQQWFPNIFKLLAMWPITFVTEFHDLIPLFMNESTAIEVFHCIIDLPCLTSSLMCQSEELQLPTSITNSLSSKTSKTLLEFMLRQKCTNGDMFESFEHIHQLFQDLQKHPRIVAAASIVGPLMEAYFEVINNCADLEMSSCLLQAILGRSNSIFAVRNLAEKLEKIFAKEVLVLFKGHPCLIDKASKEICNFVCNSKDPSQPLCTNLIAVIGQYTYSVYCTTSTVELIRIYYDNLECIAYEHLTNLSPRTTSITLATMVKLASRCQELVPRVLLCLSKINQFAKSFEGYEWLTVTTCLEEAVALLNEPNIAASTLSPTQEYLSGRHHCDNGTLPVLWRAASALVQASLAKH